MTFQPEPSGATTLVAPEWSEVTPGDKAQSTRRRGFFGTLLRDPFALFAVIVLVLVIVCAVAPSLIATESATKVDAVSSLKGPSAEHLFGTDQFGRDVFSRVVYGAHISLLAGLATTALALVVGAIVGLSAGYFGGLTDSISMRLIDIVLAFPSLLLALTVIAVRGRGLNNVVLALGIASIPGYARLIRGQVLAIRTLPYMEAARASGTRARANIMRHIIPNAATPVIIFATLGIGISILAVSSLSFLGLGPQPPTAEWGAMLSEGRLYLQKASWISIYPGLAIALTVIAVNLFGQFVREYVEARGEATS